jgi:hypothetical protein
VFFDQPYRAWAGTSIKGYPVPAHMVAAAERYRYHRPVFVAPPGREIYTTDTERRQTFTGAARAYDTAVATYTGTATNWSNCTHQRRRPRAVRARHAQGVAGIASRARAGMADRASAT